MNPQDILFEIVEGLKDEGVEVEVEPAVFPDESQSDRVGQVNRPPGGVRVLEVLFPPTLRNKVKSISMTKFEEEA